jgi:tetratricopeptide (TPR) repeat protein
VALCSRSFGFKPFWWTGGIVASTALTLVSMAQVMQWKDSVSLFSRAVEVQPHFWFARVGFATALASVGRFDEALDQLHSALKLPGSAAEVHRMLGVCMFGQHRYAAALEHFQRSYDLKPSSAAILMLAHLYSGQDDPSLRNGAQAMKYASEALRALPDPDGKALLVVAAAHAADGHPAKAIHFTERAFEQGKRSADDIMMREAAKRRRAYERPSAKNIVPSGDGDEHRP